MAQYNLNNITPCKTFCSGEYLKDELEARGISVVEFAQASNMSLKDIQNFMQGKKDITLEQSQQMGRVLGLDDDFFLDMQKMYYADLQKIQHKEQRRFVPSLQRITRAIYRYMVCL